MNDSDLLVAVVLKKRTSESTNKLSSRRKSKRDSEQERNWFIGGKRTLLSWLIHSGVVFLNELIKYRSPKDDFGLKESIVTRDGLICLCCNEMFSLSNFANHAGSGSKWPCTNLFTESGKPLVLCQLEAWSEERKVRKSDVETCKVEDGDDLCGICGHEGDLVLCDNCPATFHQACLLEQLPEGNWYCRQCRCWTCWDMVNDETPSVSPGTLRCSMCEHRYHEACMKGKNANFGLTSDKWFCGQRCHEIYESLQSRIGMKNHVSDSISWRLLKCINGDFKAHSSKEFITLKAEANSRLAVAITLIESCFVKMVDPKTKTDMIPQTIYNWGSPFPRLNFEGFYTVVLEKNDVVVSVASIRIHGTELVELPFIATCSKFQKQGMCRLLLCSIEQMLKALKVKKLMLPAEGPELVQVWTKKFDFQPLDEDEEKSLRKTNLMVLPNSTWLKKPL